MKKLTLTLVLALSFSFAYSQQLFFEAYSGYHLTSYDDEGFDMSEGYVPIGFKVAGGHEHVQLGIDYRQHITNPEFAEVSLPNEPTIPAFSDLKETYYGLFLRGNLSSLPAYRFGLIGSVGAGYYTPTQRYYLGGEKLEANLNQTLEYDRKVGYNFYIGISAPIYAQLHWELGYQLNMVDHVLKENLVRAGNYHSIHVGLSGNLVFGNTEKKCRRVITSSGRGRR